MHRKVAIAIAAALALAMASCGGSETTTLSRAALVRRVELACRAGLDATSRKQRANARSPDAIAAVLTGQTVLAEKLEALEASGAARDDFDAFKEGIRSRLEAIEKVAAASRAEQQRVLRSVQADANKASTRIATSVRNLGIEGCS